MGRNWAAERSDGYYAEIPGTSKLIYRTGWSRGRLTSHLVQAVTIFQQWAATDPLCAHYFVRDGGLVDLRALRRHQVNLVIKVTGDGAPYLGKAMTDAHAHLGVTEQAFDRVVDLLAHSLRHAGFPEVAIAEVAETIEPLRPAICTPPRPPDRTHTRDRGARHER